MNDVFVSVIIPVYNDWGRLAVCLEALSNQTYPAHLYEIIVINNNPRDKVPADFAIPENCRIVNESKAGSYAARNTGIRLSKGHILGFTDSDCIPDKNWIRNGVGFLQADQNYTRVAGRIDLFFQSDNLTPGELYEKVYAFNQDQYVKRDGTGVTANLFTYRHVFDDIGLFNEGLLSGGDYEWGIRTRDADYVIGYGDQVVISHPARSSVKELVKKAKRVGGGQALFDYEKPNKPTAVLYFLYNLRPPLRSFRMVYKKGRDLSVSQKATVLYIHYYLSVVTAWEKFKVHLGKVPSRA